MTSTNPYVTRKLFSFFRELKQNNTRAWFQDNKQRYETDVREPLLQFISDFAPSLRRISPYLVCDTSRAGGSLFRIHRDVRFAKDKTPYKTGAGIHFRHAQGKDVHAPGYYLHLEPGAVFAGAGIWQPDTQTLTGIREAIVANPARWQKITGKKRKLPISLWEGERLKRAPRGFDPDHPLLEDLKRKDFILSTDFTRKAVCAEDFVKLFEQFCRETADFMRLLTEALGLEW